VPTAKLSEWGGCCDGKDDPMLTFPLPHGARRVSLGARTLGPSHASWS
jgi:hypothetical protein